MAWLGQRYELVLQSDIFARQGYLAGQDARRAAELSRAMREPGVKAIVVARGGYGATRILSGLPWDAMSPRWLVGFSDTTALHVRSLGRGLACIHGPHVTGLGASNNPHLPQNRGAWLAALERPTQHRAWCHLRALTSGEASGRLFGGNLTLLFSMAAANALHIPPGSIVLLEDVSERPYRVDRMLTALIEGGHLASAAAVVFGSFEQCDAAQDGVTADEVLAERSRVLQIPVFAGAPFGHGNQNEAFILGARAELRSNALSWCTP